MIDPRAELTETYRAMSTEELVERWTDGHLTEIAMEVAREEFRRRGIPVPPISRPEDGEHDALAQAINYVTVARSLVPAQIHVLRARLEAEGIPSFVADEEMNRMISLYSVALGGIRLMVPEQFAGEARQIIHLVNSGQFDLREGDGAG